MILKLNLTFSTLLSIREARFSSTCDLTDLFRN